MDYAHVSVLRHSFMPALGYIINTFSAEPTSVEPIHAIKGVNSNSPVCHA